jgi:hypothetical protein
VTYFTWHLIVEEYFIYCERYGDYKNNKDTRATPPLGMNWNESRTIGVNRPTDHNLHINEDCNTRAAEGVSLGVIDILLNFNKTSLLEMGKFGAYVFLQ